MGTGIRLPLRVLLPLFAVGLAAAAAGAVGLAEVSAARGYLMQRADEALAACAAGPLSHHSVEAVPGSGLVLPGPCAAELLSAGGQLLTSAVPGAPARPALPVGARPAVRAGQPVTVPATGGGGGWRMVVAAVHYQPRRIMYVYGPDDLMYVIGGRTGPAGLLVVMTGLAGVGQVTGRVAAGYATAAVTVLAALAGATLALVRAFLRPPRPVTGDAPAAGGEPRPIRAPEAAARRATAEMTARLGEVALDLRTSVSVVRGFAEYVRERRPPPSAGLDRMAERVAAEVARMETLIERLRSAADPTKP